MWRERGATSGLEENAVKTSLPLRSKQHTEKRKRIAQEKKRSPSRRAKTLYHPRKEV